MPGTDLADGDISLLCDIAGGLSGPLESSKLDRVIVLIATGLIRRESTGDGSRLRLTEKGQELLAERGVGIHEA
ncbi:DUF4364 family protein [Bradyrhizobium sp. G127]|jgi:CTP-dependent riboflavin kinase|uniref:DUF4364 family protein n=1 Tax=Bradyrhizobium sp. G127 TaxID=2904800 RepID=UPI001F2F0312|nr:DUF4364 family protein [Bradyrhizobium sp. G127]MCF2524158.1 DUF4364 family protein [Bradyrhizobium sp. G127]